MEIAATIKEIRFRNDSNGWTVLLVALDDGTKTAAVGAMPVVGIGEHVSFTGEWTEHQIYGKQFKVDTVKINVPTDAKAITAYLSSGFVKGIGEAMAKLIVGEFGDKTLDVIKDSPEKLTVLPGIGKKRAKQIHDSYMEKISMQSVVMGMQQLGLTISMAMKLYKLYGDDCVARVKENPYRLIDDVENVGFRTADKIACEAGYEADSDFRIKAGIKYALQLARQEGNTCLPKDLLLAFTSNNLLGVEQTKVSDKIEELIMTAELTETSIDGSLYAFLPYMHYIESECAVRLKQISDRVEILPLFDIDDAIGRIEKKKGIILAPLQAEAVKSSCSDGVLIITGGPGTGKTTILSFIITIMERIGLSIELAAPTGRAAKRMSDATGREARTIHRLLEYNFSDNEFARNADYPLETDVVIVDEMSMVDVPLFNSLLRAIDDGTRLIMVGDVDQLPSVGPGNVLHDLVDAEFIPVIRLNQIYRQAGRSMIVTNAHLINEGRMPYLSNEEADFMFFPCSRVDIAIDSVVNICLDYAYMGKQNDIQVLSPMKNNPLGVYNLNARLQAALNPADDEKNECTFAGITYREGDRVMQIKNNYDIVWTKPAKGLAKEEEGQGVFNGDIGTVMYINNVTKLMTVLFDDERSADYNTTQLEELELAYCISVHKSQGSEFPAVVLPLMSGPAMLMNRNILYTAVTRARSNVFIIGSGTCVEKMVQNTNIKRRYSALKHFIEEIKNGTSL